MSRIVILGGAVVLAMAGLAWQNHAGSQRMARLADRVEVVAENSRRPQLVLPPRPTPVLPESPPPRAPAPAPAPVEPDPEEVARVASAQQKADEIIRSGVLAPEDVERLRAELDALPRAEAFAIRKRLAHALNTEKVVPTEFPVELP